MPSIAAKCSHLVKNDMRQYKCPTKRWNLFQYYRQKIRFMSFLQRGIGKLFGQLIRTTVVVQEDHSILVSVK